MAKPGEAIRSGDLSVRIASAVLLAAVALLGAYFGGVFAGLVAAAVAAIVHLEWAGVTARERQLSLPLALAVVAAIMVASAGSIAIGFAIAGVAVLAAATIGREPWLPLGVAYAASLGLSLIVLRLAPEYGLAAVIVLFAVVWATDTGAYVAGRTIGGPKLWPRISPRKTWAGAIGGLLAAIVAGSAAAVLSGIAVTLPLLLVMIVLSIASQIGDLFESWVKRCFGVKDSGHLIPGHGGLMDRVDGLTFAGALAASIGAAHGGAGALARGLLLW
jgi:phosphatidate cytidylyltransferase